MDKKVIKTIIIILAIIILLYLLWLLLVPKPKIPNKVETKTATTSEEKVSLPITTSSSTEEVEENSTPTTQINLSKISTNPALGYWISPPTEEIKYISFDGTIWGTATLPNKQLSSQKINGVKNVIPYKDGSKILISYESKDGLKWLVYDSLDDSLSPLPSYIKNAFWGENNTKIFAITKGIEEGSKKYDLSSLDLSKTLLVPNVLINNFNFPDAEFKFIPPQTIIITESPSAFYKSAVWSLDLKTKSLNKIIEEKKGLLAKVADDEETLIYASREGDTYTFFANINTLSRSTARLFTIPYKCNTPIETSTQMVFCFESSDIINNIKNFPDNYLQRDYFSVDTLYLYNKEKETITSLLISGTSLVEPIDGIDIKIKNNQLYFINRLNNNIYKITLPEQILSNNQ